MSPDKKLAHSLKVKFGTAPGQTSDVQLLQIKNTIQKIQSSGRAPTEQDWLKAVTLHCPSTGHYKYAGIDNSDLNTLLALATQVANRREGDN